MIVPSYYEDLHVLHDKTMPDRAYYIPAEKRMDCLVQNREKSGRIQMLNGSWQFRYYESLYDLTEQFYRTDYDAESFFLVPVPGEWQQYGCDSP